MGTGQYQTGERGTRPEPVRNRIDEVCDLAAEGLTDNQIALKLNISKHTVVNYWRRLREKYRLTNRTALVVRHLGTKIEQRAAQLEQQNKSLIQQNGQLVVENAKLKDFLNSGEREHEICTKALRLTKAFVYRITADPPYRCLYISPSASDFGIDIDAFLSGRCSWYDVIPAEDLLQLRELTDNAPPNAGEQDCLIFRLKGQPPMWIAEIQRPYTDESTGERCFVGMVVSVDSLVREGVLPPKVARICHPKPA